MHDVCFLHSVSHFHCLLIQAQIRVIPAARVQVVGETRPVPWWAIVIPIVAAIIIITVVAVLLWVVSVSAS